MRPEFTSDLLNCRCRETTLKISAQTHIITSILDHAGVDRPSSKDRLSRKSPNVHSAGWFQIEMRKKKLLKTASTLVSQQAELYFQLVADYKDRAAKVETTNYVES